MRLRPSALDRSALHRSAVRASGSAPGSVHCIHKMNLEAVPDEFAAPAHRSPALWRLARPKQWIKNVLVIAAPGAAGVLTEGDALFKTAVAFVCFCLAASAT